MQPYSLDTWGIHTTTSAYFLTIIHTYCWWFIYLHGSINKAKAYATDTPRASLYHYYTIVTSTPGQCQGQQQEVLMLLLFTVSPTWDIIGKVLSGWCLAFPGSKAGGGGGTTVEVEVTSQCCQAPPTCLAPYSWWFNTVTWLWMVVVSVVVVEVIVQCCQASSTLPFPLTILLETQHNTSARPPVISGFTITTLHFLVVLMHILHLHSQGKLPYHYLVRLCFISLQLYIIFFI